MVLSSRIASVGRFLFAKGGETTLCLLNLSVNLEKAVENISPTALLHLSTTGAGSGDALGCAGTGGLGECHGARHHFAARRSSAYSKQLRITACVVEEVDLLCKSNSEDWLRLFPGPKGLFALSKSLLAFLQPDKGCLVTTLAEARADLEFVSHLPQDMGSFRPLGLRFYAVFRAVCQRTELRNALKSMENG